MPAMTRGTEEPPWRQPWDQRALSSACVVGVLAGGAEKLFQGVVSEMSLIWQKTNVAI